ncbi:MAG TPA: hypothetical protein VFL42_07930 [Terriglobales bacterium]|nr:hypothetical protein [Terriglobales bacterium]
MYKANDAGADEASGQQGQQGIAREWRFNEDSENEETNPTLEPETEHLLVLLGPPLSPVASLKGNKPAIKELKKNNKRNPQCKYREQTVS